MGWRKVTENNNEVMNKSLASLFCPTRSLENDKEEEEYETKKD